MQHRVAAQRLAQRRALAPLRRLLDDLRGGVRLLHLRPDGLARRRVDDHDVQLVGPALPQELRQHARRTSASDV